MTAPRGEVVHRLPGRARVRLESQVERAVLERAAEGLRAIAHVSDVSVNPVSHGLLLRHRGELEPILEYAAQQDLFVIAPPERPPGAPLEWLYDTVAAVDRALKSRRGEGHGLATYTVYALIGASAYQLARGKFLPAGGAMLFQAMSLVTRERQGALGAEPD